MSIEDCIAWWRFTHPELFAVWVGLLLVDTLVWMAFLIVKASESESASKIIKWRW